MIEYNKIFRQAYSLTKTHKFLWLFGLFLFWGNVLNLAYTLQGNQGSSSNDFYSNSVVRWLQTHPQASFWILLGFAILLTTFVYLYFRSKIASIIAIKALVEKQETSLSQSLQVSRWFFSRVIGLSIVLNLVWFALTVVVATPILYLFSTGQIGRGSILALLGATIILPTSLVILFLNILGPMFIVCFDLTIGEAVRNSFDLIAKYWPRLTLFGVSLLVGVLISVIVSVIIALVPFVLLAVLAYHKMTALSNFFLQTITIGLGIIVFLALQSVVVIFQQTSWVLVFLDLVKPEKLEDEAAVGAAEVIS